MATKQNSKPQNLLVADGVTADTFNNVLAVLSFLDEVEYCRRPESTVDDRVRHGGHLVLRTAIDALEHLQAELASVRSAPVGLREVDSARAATQ